MGFVKQISHFTNTLLNFMMTSTCRSQSNQMEIRCSLVIPAYNEGEVLRKTLSRISETLEIEFECIVVVDEISDTSVSIIQEFQSMDPRFILLVNDVLISVKSKALNSKHKVTKKSTKNWALMRLKYTR